MVFRPDDLASLVAPGRGAELGFHSGTVVTWNASTGANTIDVAGATISDVPILNTSEVVQLEAGHVVALLRFQSSYFILGRVTVPGSSQFASAAVDFAWVALDATGFVVNQTHSAKVSGNIYGPAWANEAVVMVTGTCSAVNQSASLDYLRGEAFIEGDKDIGSFAVATANSGSAHVAVTSAHGITRSNFDTTPIEVKADFWTDFGGWGAHGSNVAALTGIAIFRS